MGFFRITKNDGTLDIKTLEKAVDVLTTISDQAQLQRETSNVQDIELGYHGGLIPPSNIVITSSRETNGVTQSDFAIVKGTWTAQQSAEYYEVEFETSESDGQGAYNKEVRSNTAFWQNITLGVTAKLRVRSCNSIYKSEWSQVVEAIVINSSYTNVGSLVISSSRLFRWIHCSVGKINRRLFPQHRGFEWQWSTTTGFIPNEQEHKNDWTWTTGTNPVVTHYGYKKLSYSNHCVFRVSSLTAPIFARCRAFDKTNNKTAWSVEYPVGNDLPASITSFEAGILPLEIGWFKRVQWRLNLEWVWAVPVGGDIDMNGSFEIQYRRGTTGLWTRHFVDLDPADKSGEHNINLAFPPKNVTPANGYVPGQYTNLYVRIRARENLIPGAWFPTSANGLQVAFVAADDADTCPTPVPTWTYTSGGFWVRDINIVCCEDTYDFPNSFSHFSIHARVNTASANWTPDTKTYRDRILGGVLLENGVQGVNCLIPWFLFKDTQTSNYTALNKVRLKTSEIISMLSIKVVPHCWEQA